MGKVTFSIGLVILGIGIGYLIQVLAVKKYIRLPIAIDAICAENFKKQHCFFSIPLPF